MAGGCARRGSPWCLLVQGKVAQAPSQVERFGLSGHTHVPRSRGMPPAPALALPVIASPSRSNPLLAAT